MSHDEQLSRISSMAKQMRACYDDDEKQNPSHPNETIFWNKSRHQWYSDRTIESYKHPTTTFVDCLRTALVDVPTTPPIDEKVCYHLALVASQHHIFEDHFQRFVLDTVGDDVYDPDLRRLRRFVLHTVGDDRPVDHIPFVCRLITFTGPSLFYFINEDFDYIDMVNFLGIKPPGVYNDTDLYQTPDLPPFATKALDEYVRRWANWVVDCLDSHPIRSWKHALVERFKFDKNVRDPNPTFFFEAIFGVSATMFEELMLKRLAEKEKMALRRAFEKMYYRCFRRAYAPEGNATKRLKNEYEGDCPWVLP